MLRMVCASGRWPHIRAWFPVGHYFFLLFSRQVMSSSATPWTAAHRASLSFTISQSLPKFMSTESWCHRTISTSVALISYLQSFPASGSSPMSLFFASGGQSIGASASASVLPVSIQGWFPLGRTGWISLQSKGLSRAFSNTAVWRHQVFSALPFSWSNSHIHGSLLLPLKWLLHQAQRRLLFWPHYLCCPPPSLSPLCIHNPDPLGFPSEGLPTPHFPSLHWSIHTLHSAVGEGSTDQRSWCNIFRNFVKEWFISS